MLKKFFSRINQPSLYIVPVEGKISDIENQMQDNFKINYANFEMKLPCKKIEKRRDDSASKFKFTGIIIDKSKGKGIFIEIPASIPPKDKNGKGISFETYSKMLYMTPDKFNFFKPFFLVANKKEVEKYQEELLLFNLKSVSTVVPHLDGIYKFESSNVKGFQFIDLYNIKKNKLVKVRIFDKNDNQYELTFIGFSQQEIDYTLASIRFKE
jgi:hypothetical protein